MVAVFDAAPVSANELVPLDFGAFVGGVAGDVVAGGFGFFAVAFDFVPREEGSARTLRHYLF
jgi:hypothetical protein